MADATKVEDAEVEQDLVDDYRRDELRRMAKVSTINAQRQVTQGLAAEISES